MKEVHLSVKPLHVDDWEYLRSQVKQKLNLRKDEDCAIVLDRKSLDARPRKPVYRLKILAYPHLKEVRKKEIIKDWPDVSKRREVHIIGAGPAGYFAALQCIMEGLKPVIYDRGKTVRNRRRDLRAIQQEGVVNPDSNYCFGEGGAGTYSDGKLYTRSYKRKEIKPLLELLIAHGAPEEIGWDAHPHIGSNKLPKIIQAIRERIIEYGGEIHFKHKLTDITLQGRRITAITLNDNMLVHVDKLILATGHSARDIFRLLHEKNIHIEAKPFALGVRIEHPQALIDEMQYGGNRHDLHLPAAPYQLAVQVHKKGVFSFCMCPGGLIVPAATAPGEIVVNGMSLSRRNSAYANSGIVTEIALEDLGDYADLSPFQGLAFQRSIEQKMYASSDGSQKAPATRLPDFLAGKLSASLPDSSYIPGLISAEFSQLLPTFVYDRLRSGIREFTRYLPQYITEEAIAVGTESRTSSPIRIPRDRKKFTHLEIENLYPCGEGAGYAGGIISAAMDGSRVVKALKKVSE